MLNRSTQFLFSGAIIGDYKLLDTLGEGSYGIVYKAINLVSGETHALKFLKKWLVPDHSLTNFMRRFELEYETGKIVSNHLVSTHYIYEINDLPYFSMDYCPNGNLQKKINNIGTNKAIDHAKEILDGLYDLHTNGKIHRDLKPENILFNAQDVAMLSDFGITGHINIQLTETTKSGRPEEIFGSYAYMAPEQRENSKRSDTLLPSIDIFSFGVICYEMMTGKLPFGDWNFTYDMEPYLYNAKNGVITDPSSYDVTLPNNWKDIIFRCLQPSKSDRYQTIDEIIYDVSGKSELSNSVNEIISSDNLKFVVLNGEQPGREYFFNTQKNLFHIGRDNFEHINDIQILEECSSYISRKQASIDVINGYCYLRDGQWSLQDNCWINSKNGTYVNYKKIDTNQTYLLRENDIILIGNTTLKTIKK